MAVRLHRVAPAVSSPPPYVPIVSQSTGPAREPRVFAFVGKTRFPRESHTFPHRRGTDAHSDRSSRTGLYNVFSTTLVLVLNRKLRLRKNDDGPTGPDRRGCYSRARRPLESCGFVRGPRRSVLLYALAFDLFTWVPADCRVRTRTTGGPPSRRSPRSARRSSRTRRVFAGNFGRQRPVCVLVVVYYDLEGISRNHAFPGRAIVALFMIYTV